MNHPGLKKNKGGARPGAGRKSLGDERAVMALRNEGIQITREALRREGIYAELPIQTIVEIASRIGVKSIPQKVEGDLVPQQIITIVRANGSKAQALSGRVSIHRSPVSGNGVSLGNGKKPLRDS